MARESGVTSSLSVDLEEHFQVSAFESVVSHDQWGDMPSRVERNTDKILELFDSHGVQATFFVLGWIAERYPELIRRIQNADHEIASHGYSHVRVTNQGHDEFKHDVDKTKKLLEDVSGTSVKGFRAASFSIVAENAWAWDLLQEVGYEYSSSVYPIHHHLYGMPHAPRFSFRHKEGGLLEIPISTLSLRGFNIPCGGGGYFRLLPYKVSRWALRRIIIRERQPAVFYLHPWEIDPDQPKQRGLNLNIRMRHYLNLHRTEARLKRLLEDFRWDRMDRVFLGQYGEHSDAQVGRAIQI